MSRNGITTRSYTLELKNTFRISHSERSFQPTFIVALREREYTGFGEAAATSYYGTSVERMTASIDAVERLVLKNLHRSPEELWEITNPYLRNDSFAQCALDIAMHDLHGKRLGLPLYKLWGWRSINFQ